MKNELIGYEIRDNYYMVSHVSVINSGKENGVEMYDVYIFSGDSTEKISKVDTTEINRIYKHDSLSNEIYKLKIEELEKMVHGMDGSIKGTLDVADEIISSLKSDINKNKRQIRGLVNDQCTEERRREYDRWRVPVTNTITEYVLPDYQKVFNIFISVAIIIIIIYLYFIA